MTKFNGEAEVDPAAEVLGNLESDRAGIRAKINLMQFTLELNTIEDFKRLVETLLVEEQKQLLQFNAMIASLRQHRAFPVSMALH